jgi:ferrous iron transport protein B
MEEKPDLIINIIDATSLERSLYLTTQLLELDVDVIIALNMADVLKKAV